MIIRFYPNFSVLVDDQGPLVLSKSEVFDLIAQCMLHLQHSDAELEAIARELIKTRCPGMEHQIDWTYLKHDPKSVGASPPTTTGASPAVDNKEIL